jgi:hypothetical protein
MDQFDFKIIEFSCCAIPKKIVRSIIVGTVQGLKILRTTRSCKSKKDKRKNNDLHNITQKTKY